MDGEVGGAGEVIVELGKQGAGQTFLTLLTRQDGPAQLAELAAHRQTALIAGEARPGPEGGQRCALVRPPRRTRAWLGFTALLSGYNGENGLVAGLELTGCGGAAGRPGPVDCSTARPACPSPLYQWREGELRGEQLAAPLAAPARQLLLLRISYNPGTGWLRSAQPRDIANRL